MTRFWSRSLGAKRCVDVEVWSVPLGPGEDGRPGGQRAPSPAPPPAQFPLHCFLYFRGLLSVIFAFFILHGPRIRLFDQLLSKESIFGLMNLPGLLAQSVLVAAVCVHAVPALGCVRGLLGLHFPTRPSRAFSRVPSVVLSCCLEFEFLIWFSRSGVRCA